MGEKDDKTTSELLAEMGYPLLGNGTDLLYAFNFLIGRDKHPPGTDKMEWARHCRSVLRDALAQAECDSNMGTSLHLRSLEEATSSRQASPLSDHDEVSVRRDE
jgi:hypothetical protein